jgi:hypothetical protein
MSGRASMAAWLATAGAAALLAGCAGKPAPAPAPAQSYPPAGLVVSPPPPPAPPVEDWPDLPLSPGDWSYAADSGGSHARFAGPEGPALRLSCSYADRQLSLHREGHGAGAGRPLRVSTSFGKREVTRAIPAGDPLLDELAFSRGRFAVETDRPERLIVPSWPEVARVIEDCRG